MAWITLKSWMHVEHPNSGGQSWADASPGPRARSRTDIDRAAACGGTLPSLESPAGSQIPTITQFINGASGDTRAQEVSAA